MPNSRCALHGQSQSNKVWTKPVDVGNWELGVDQAWDFDFKTATSKCTFNL